MKLDGHKHNKDFSPEMNDKTGTITKQLHITKHVETPKTQQQVVIYHKGINNLQLDHVSTKHKQSVKLW